MKRLLLAVFFTTMSTAAQAQTAEGDTTLSAGATAGMDNVASGFGLLSYWYAQSGLGVGVRFQKTIVREGVLRTGSVRDDVGIEGGLDYFHYSFSGLGFDSSYNELAVLVGAVWNFWFLDGKLALYPKVDVGYRFGSWSMSSIGGYGGVVFQGSGGIAYRLARLTLRAEAGSGSLRLGAGFAF